MGRVQGLLIGRERVTYSCCCFWDDVEWWGRMSKGGLLPWQLYSLNNIIIRGVRENRTEYVITQTTAAADVWIGYVIASI